MAGTLYLLPVSLGDTPWDRYLPLHVRETACKLSRFIVENAKTARAELKRVGHPQPLRAVVIEEIPTKCDPASIDRLLMSLLQGIDMGLMSEAGCPAVADPGALIVRRAHELDIPVMPLVGPSSLLLGLMASGLDGQRFAFHGYLPAREPERSQRIIALEQESSRWGQTQLFIETPYRNKAMLDTLLKCCQPSTRLCIATDLTLPTQEIVSCRIEQWHARTLPQLDKRPTLFLLLSER